MAVTFNEPNIAQAQMMMVFSDAPTNAEAVREISKWVREHGFVRPKEYWLQQSVKDGKTFYQSACYRLTKENLQAADEKLEEIARRREQMPFIDLATMTK